MISRKLGSAKMDASVFATWRQLSLFVKKLAKSSWSLVRNQGIWQTKNLLFHGWMLVGVGGSGILVLSEKNRVPFLVTTLYVACSILAYWLNEVKFIRSGASRRLWKKHVIDPRRNRISVAIRVRIQDLGYVILMFCGWFLVAGNIIYWKTGSIITRDWIRAVLHVIHSAGIQTNRSYQAEGMLGVLLTVATSMSGLVFVGVWVAIFISDFAIIFGKDDDERARRLSAVVGRHRTSRLRRTRRSKL
jgi:hypothetical protein